MASYVVWMDHEHAKLMKFLIGGKTEQHTVKHHQHAHHAGPTHGGHDEHTAYYKEVAKHLADAGEVLLVGPGLGKDHFQKHLTTHHHQDLAKKIVGVVAMDHPTDKQIIAEARKFFRAKDLFDSNV